MKKEHFLRSVGTCVVAILLAIYPMACATMQLSHIGSFSQASADLAKQAADAYADVNDTAIERRIFEIAVTAETPTNATFKKTIDDSNLAVRISLLRGIEDYSKALGNLASADFRKEIDKASKDLYGALGGLQTAYAAATKKALPLSDDKLGIIATAVDAIGTAMAEDKRREALKAVIIQANPSIKESMRLLSEELPVLQNFASENLNTIYSEKVKAYQKEAAKLSFNQRVARLRDIRQAYERIRITSILLEEIGTAGKKISDAHTALYKAVAENKFTTDELVREVKNVVGLAKSIKDFHDKLQMDKS